MFRFLCNSCDNGNTYCVFTSARVSHAHPNLIMHYAPPLSEAACWDSHMKMQPFTSFHSPANAHTRIISQAKSEMTGPFPTTGRQTRQRGPSAPSVSHSSAAVSFPHFVSPPFYPPPCDAPRARQIKGETPTRPSITRLVTPPSSFLSARRLQKACNYGLRSKRREHPSTPSLIHLTLTACGDSRRAS